jgi:hypothetical protein
MCKSQFDCQIKSDARLNVRMGTIANNAAGLALPPSHTRP